MRSERYLDAVKERHGLTSDTALAEFLGVTQAGISHYRSGRRTMDNETCLRIAQALDMADPMPIIMAADMDRAERAGQRSLWEVFSKRMPMQAAPASLAVLVAVVGGSVTKFVTSPTLQAKLDAISRLGHSILC